MAENIRAIGHYSAAEVGRLAGVSGRRIGQWARYGIIPSTGPQPRDYSYADAAEAVLARYLISEGYETWEVRRVVEILRNDWGTWPLTRAPLAHDGKLLVIRESGDIHLSAAEPGQQVMPQTLLDLRQIRDALAAGGWVAFQTRREHIEVDPERLSGRPTIKGRRVATAVVASIAQDPDGWEALRENYNLTDEQIADAVAYEADVDKAIAA